MKKITDGLDVFMAILLLIEVLLALFIAVNLFSNEANAEDFKEGIPLTAEEMKRAYYREPEVILIEVNEAAPVAVEEQTEYLIEITDEEIDLLARVVMSEGGVLVPQDCLQAIATTVVNRVRDDKYEFRNQNTVTDVVYHANAYSTQNNGEPTPECYEAVFAALTYEAFPQTMFYFREGKYHSFGKNYTNIGTTYFSMR